MNKLLLAMIGMVMAGAAGAKLPPPSEEAKAKADEAKSKAAWSDKVAAYQLCMAQDKVAARFKKTGSAVAAAPMPAAAGASAATPPAAAAPAAAAPAAGAAPAAPPVATVAAAPAAAPIPPCQDPGPYMAAQSGAKVGVADALPVPAAGKPVTAADAKK